MRDFRNFQVWKKAHALTLAVYRVTEQFPSNEEFGLISQLHRATSSIAAILAEESGRDTDGDFKRFVDIAGGSACEVEYHLLLAHDLGLIYTAEYQDLDHKINEIKKMLGAFGKRMVQPKLASTS